jgi:hypothetical protein
MTKVIGILLALQAVLLLVNARVSIAGATDKEPGITNYPLDGAPLETKVIAFDALVTRKHPWVSFVVRNMAHPDSPPRRRYPSRGVRVECGLFDAAGVLIDRETGKMDSAYYDHLTPGEISKADHLVFMNATAAPGQKVVCRGGYPNMSAGNPPGSPKPSIGCAYPV